MYDDKKLTPAQQQRIYEWLKEQRIYSTTLYNELIGFFIFLVCASIFFIIFDNLFINFLGLLAGIGFLIYSVYVKSVFGFSEEQIQQKLYESFTSEMVSHHYRQRILDYVDEYGVSKLSDTTRCAIVLITGTLFFELFFIDAWVKNYELVWQPDWIKYCILWVVNHTQFPTFGVNDGFFHFFIESDDILADFYQSELQFLESKTADVVMLFHLIKIMTLSLFSVGMMIFLQSYVQWQDLWSLNEDKLEEFKALSIRQIISLAIWYIAIVPILVLMLFYIFISMVIIPISTDLKVESLIGLFDWLLLLWQNLAVLLPVTAIWLIWKTLCFFRYLISSYTS